MIGSGELQQSPAPPGSSGPRKRCQRTGWALRDKRDLWQLAARNASWRASASVRPLTPPANPSDRTASLLDPRGGQNSVRVLLDNGRAAVFATMSRSSARRLPRGVAERSQPPMWLGCEQLANVVD